MMFILSILDLIHKNGNRDILPQNKQAGSTALKHCMSAPTQRHDKVESTPT